MQPAPFYPKLGAFHTTPSLKTALGLNIKNLVPCYNLALEGSYILTL